MDSCRHRNLLLLPQRENSLRCRHCHLTISPRELQGGCCPECYATDGTKRYEFDEIEARDKGRVRYRCEECGAIIESD